MMNKIISNELIEDVQNTIDERHLDIDQVGIRSIKHPVEIKPFLSADFISSL